MKIYILILTFLIGGYSMNSVEKKINLPVIPLEDFFRNPEKSSFKLSPNGGYIAYMKPWVDGNRMMNVYVKEMNSSNETRITNASERSIYGYFWLNENRIAYIQDKGGDENIHIYAVDINGKNDIDLTPYDNVKANIIDDLEDNNLSL